MNLNNDNIDYSDLLSKVEIGMRINEVENIIGQPDIIAPNIAPQASFVYKYRKPEGYEGIFELAVDSSLIVVDISNTIRKIE